MTETMTVAEFRAQQKKAPKYGNIVTYVDGYRFASRKEMQRYKELKLLKAADAIWDLKIHPKYDFRINGVFIGSYRADFSYREHGKFEEVVEDTKSVATKKARDWPLRRNLMKALYGVEVRVL